MKNENNQQSQNKNDILLELQNISKDMKQVVEENNRLNTEILRLSKKMNNFIIWQQVFGVLKILIIIVPIILGIIYLPPLLDKAFEPYKELLGIDEAVKGGNIPASLMDKLK